MLVTRSDVEKQFLAVLNSEISREDANRWAYSVMQAFEEKDIKFEPQKEQELIWDGVMYLYGIDLLDAPGLYLYSEDDIRQEMNRRFGDRN